jgi:hypothetical protein
MKSTIIVLLIGGLLAGCASNDKGDFTVTIIPPEIESLAKKDDSSVSVTFKQKDGKISSQTVQAEGRYTGGEDATTNDVRAKAIDAMIKSASDQVNGQLISNSINIRQEQIGSGELEQTRRDVVSQTIGLGKLLSKPDCRRAETTGLDITMICSGAVSVPLIDSVTVKREGFDS